MGRVIAFMCLSFEVINIIEMWFTLYFRIENRDFILNLDHKLDTEENI